MKTAVAAGSKAAELDFRKSLLETFAVNEKSNQLLLIRIEDQAWQVQTPSGKGLAIADIAAIEAFKTSFGLGEWDTLWRQCGFGK